jgi:tetratricopeptide (TPR) repeat protein
VPSAQAPAPSPQRQQTPAAKAMNDASAVKDLDERIAAIRKVVADFPKTPQVAQANTLLLDALIKKGDTAAAAAQAKVIVSGADEASKSRLQRDVASALLRGDVLLDEAELYAKGAVDSLPDEKTYVETRRKEDAARAASRAAESADASSGAPPSSGALIVAPPSAAPPGEDSLLSRYRNEKQSALSTLGQVYAKRGKTAEAEKALRDAYLVDRSSATAATAALKLADYAKAAGRDGDQFDYLAAVSLAGRLTPAADIDLRAVYRKLHDGSIDGLERELDGRYEKEGPKAPEVPKYERAADRSDRLVLAEVFTGSGCPPCVAADLAFESAMHRYPSTEMVVLMYHLHVPRPDPMANPYTQSRAKFYAVPGVPTYAIDGDARTGGGNAAAARSLFEKNVGPAVDKRLATKAVAELTLKASSTGRSVTATVTAAPAGTGSSKLRLHLVLAEQQIRYSGENGIRFHPMVVRSMASVGVEPPKPPAEGAKPEATPTLPVPILGVPLEAGKVRTFEYTFDLAKVEADGLANLEDLEQHSTRYPDHRFLVKKHELDPTKLLIVAFVQDEESKQVMQAVQVAVK